MIIFNGTTLFIVCERASPAAIERAVQKARGPWELVHAAPCRDYGGRVHCHFRSPMKAIDLRGRDRDNLP